jgi:hypothetical protein
LGFGHFFFVGEPPAPRSIGVGIGIGIDSETVDRPSRHGRSMYATHPFLVSKSHLLSFDSDTDPDHEYYPYRDRDAFVPYWRSACSWFHRCRGRDRDRDRFRLFTVVGPHARCSFVTLFSSPSPQCAPARLYGPRSLLAKAPHIRFSCPNPVFCPSIPIPIPTPTPIIIPTGGWHLQLVASVAQQQEASSKSAIFANES